MKLHRLRHAIVADVSDVCYEVRTASWDELVAREDLENHLRELVKAANSLDLSVVKDSIAPIGRQEVWAAGVTYYRSRDARMEESKSAGGGDFYDRVYHAERPELFFK